MKNNLLLFYIESISLLIKYKKNKTPTNIRNTSVFCRINNNNLMKFLYREIFTVV